MRAAFLLLSAIVCLSALSGCARFNSIHRTTPLLKNEDVAEAISVDAKQRFLLSGKRDGVPIFCSEPSPDVFSVFSAALEAQGSKAEAFTAALKMATSESGGTVGIRTESIQLLRDAMYRICEAYLSRGIDPEQYSDMLRRYQKSMVTLIAIEQLTGAARPAQIILKAGADIDGNDAALTAKQKMDGAHAALTAAKDTATKATETLEKAKKDLGGDYAAKCTASGKPDSADVDKCSAVKDAAEKSTQAQTDLTAKKQDAKDWEKVFASVGAGVHAGGGETVVSPPTTASPEAVAVLGSQVRELVRDVFMDDYIRTCIGNHIKDDAQSDNKTVSLSKTEPDARNLLASKLDSERQAAASLLAQHQADLAELIAKAEQASTAIDEQKERVTALATKQPQDKAELQRQQQRLELWKSEVSNFPVMIARLKALIANDQANVDNRQRALASIGDKEATTRQTCTDLIFRLLNNGAAAPRDVATTK
jgi:hypothetical protein